MKPVVSEPIQSSGHRTLRVFFADVLALDQRHELLRSLNDLRACFERATARPFAIDVEPEGSHQVVCDRLAAWEVEGLLSYETRDARVVGSFDDAPEETESE
jgi:hypothetical protein